MQIANTSASLATTDCREFDQRCKQLNQINIDRHGIPAEGLRSLHTRGSTSLNDTQRKLSALVEQTISDDYKLSHSKSSVNDSYQGPLPVIIGEVHLNDKSRALHQRLGSFLQNGYTDKIFDSDLLVEGCKSYQGSSRHGFEDTVLRNINGLMARSIESLSDFFDFIIADSLRHHSMQRALEFNAALGVNGLEPQIQLHESGMLRNISMIARWLFNSGSDCPLNFNEREELIRSCNQRMVQKLIELYPQITSVLTNAQTGNGQVNLNYLNFRSVEIDHETTNVLTRTGIAAGKLWNEVLSNRDQGMVSEMGRAGNRCFPVKVGVAHIPGIAKKLNESKIPYFLIEPKDIEKFIKTYQS